LSAWSRARGLRLVEDCAQGFSSPADHGSRAADISLFSFGTIKTMTAFGGALAVVRNPSVLRRMRATHARWPIQPTARYAAKVARAALLMGAQQPLAYRAIERVASLTGHTIDKVILNAVRGFPVPPGGTLRPLLQFRPSGAMLATLRQRLRTFDAATLERRAEQGEFAHGILRHRAPLLGDAALERTHWIVAITSNNRARLVARGRAIGLDLAAGASNIAAVPRPPERPDLEPLEAERFMRRIVFVPANATVPRERLQRLADLLAMDRIVARESAARTFGGVRQEPISLP
jgi:perosamine synthetase